MLDYLPVVNQFHQRGNELIRRGIFAETPRARMYLFLFVCSDDAIRLHVDLCWRIKHADCRFTSPLELLHTRYKSKTLIP